MINTKKAGTNFLILGTQKAGNISLHHALEQAKGNR